MFKGGRWRSEKNRLKVLFKLQFQATQVPPSKWENLVITLIPVDVGKPTARSEKAAVTGGSCRWEKPIYETVKFFREPKTGKISEKIYHILVSAMGFPKATLLGEVAIDFAGYVETIKPFSLSLPLKTSESDVLLHVTIQRTQDEPRTREIEGNGETMGKPQRRTLLSQLSNSDGGEDTGNPGEIDGLADSEKSTAEGERKKFPSARAMVQDAEFSPNLITSRSFDAVSVAWSDTSSGRYTPGDGASRSTIYRQDSTSLLSPLGNNGTPQRQDSDDLVALARQIEVSDLEIQALRKQVVKERKLAGDLSKDLQSVKEERDRFRRECDELMASRRDKGDGWETEREKLRSVLEEVKQELDHEKTQNAGLRLQLKKMQDSNSELMLEIRDLDEILQKKNSEASDGGCEDYHEKKEGTMFSYLRHQEGNQESKIVQEREDDEQYALEELIKEREIKVAISLEQKILELNNDIDLYRKDREELEMQMEQLALDYEILKQENHDISSKLEQTQLREQLRMQYECSAHVSIINELEGQVEKLETELEKQAEDFEADLTALTSAKVEQEKRAIELEEALRKARRKNVNIAEYLMEELERISVQVFSMFGKNEKLAAQALAEASQLRLRKNQLVEMMKVADDRHRSQIEDFENEVALGKGHIERLYGKLREKSEELDREKRSKAEQHLSFSEELARLKAQIEPLKNEENGIFTQRNGTVDLGNRLERSNGSLERNGRLPPNGSIKGEVTRTECSPRKGETKSNEAYGFGNGILNIEVENSSLNSSLEKKQAETEPSIISPGGTRDSPLERCLSMEAVDPEFGINEEILLSPNPEKRRYTKATNGVDKEPLAGEKLCEIATLREKNKSMEAELKEMQERYSEISLKFAQVEGERQELVMTVRTLKNALKS